MANKQTLLVVALLSFVTGAAGLSCWFILGKPVASTPVREAAVEVQAAATPAESVDWNKLYYEPAHGRVSGKPADSFTLSDQAGGAPAP